jgi:hypothetical protein
MRERADATRIRALLRELGRRSNAPARVYLTGGATAVLEGWRTSTIDIDLSFDPDDDALLRLLPDLKERLDVNIELVAPGDFIPALPGWRDRSPFVCRVGAITATRQSTTRHSPRRCVAPLADRDARGSIRTAPHRRWSRRT